MMNRLNLSIPSFSASIVTQAQFDNSKTWGINRKLPKADYFGIRVDDNRWEYFQLNQTEMAKVNKTFKSIGGQGNYTHVKLDTLRGTYFNELMESSNYAYPVEAGKKTLEQASSEATTKYTKPIMDCVVQLLKKDGKLDKNFVPATSVFA